MKWVDTREIAIALSEDETTMKTFELIFSQFARCRAHSSIS